MPSMMNNFLLPGKNGQEFWGKRDGVLGLDAFRGH